MALSQWFGVVVNAISAIIVAVIGYFGVRNATRSAREKKLQEQIEADEKRRSAEAQDQIIETLEKLSGRVDDLAKTLIKIQKDNEHQNHDIDQVSKLSKIGMDYTRSISNVVTALAEGLRDNNIDGNVTRALETYRAFESKQLHAMYEFVTPKDDD